MTPEQELLTRQLEAAEKAVACVKDVRLQEIAFGRILDQLLASNTPEGKKTDSVSAAKRTKTKSPPEHAQTASSASREKSKTGPTDGIRCLIEDGDLDSPKSREETAELLKQAGRHYAKDAVGVALLRLARERVLTRLKEQGDKNWKYVVRR